LNYKERLLALLSYVPILFIIPLKRFRKSEFIYYHAKQGLGLFILSMVLIFSFWLPVVGWVAAMAFLVLWFTGIMNVLTGKKEPIPVIGRISEKVSI
jgi:fumarate reductase subunit D